MAKTVRIIASPGLTSQRIRLYEDQDGPLVATSEVIAAATGSPLNYQQTIVVAAGEYFATIADSADADNVDYWGYVTITADDPATFDVRGVKAADLPALQTTALSVLQDTGTTLPAQIAGISSGAGSGARTVTVTVNDGTDTLQNATVRMTEGVNTYTALTNASGVAVFNLDDATYVVGVSKSGYTFAGTTLVVNGTEAATYSMTQVAVSPPDDASASTGVAIVYDENEQPEASVPVYFRKYVTGGPGTAGYIEDYAIKTLTSDANGNIEGEFRRLWTYEVWRGDGSIKRRFTVPDASSFSIAEALGADV